MRFSSGIVIAAAFSLGVSATANNEAAEVFILEKDAPASSKDVPNLPKEVARHILLQRVRFTK
jgi:hypothetical protein